MSYEDLELNCDHLIHGDYLDHNVFFDKDHSVQSVFDFEKTNYSPRVYELFRSLLCSILSPEMTTVDLKNAKKYIDAYSSVYPLSEDEIKKGLQLFFTKGIHGTWVEGEYYLKNNPRVSCFLSDDYHRIKNFPNNFETLKKYLID